MGVVNPLWKVGRKQGLSSLDGHGAQGGNKDGRRWGGGQKRRVERTGESMRVTENE